MKRRTRSDIRKACLPKPKLKDRELLSNEQAMELETTFKILANSSRLRLLHALARSRELSVLDLAAQVEMKPQAVSNQLQRMNGQSILASRREGNQIFYRIADPCVVKLLDRGLCLTEDSRSQLR